MWILPSRRRLANLQRFFAAYKATGGSTPGMVIVDLQDYCENLPDYEALDLPPGWFIRRTEGETQGDKLREVWAEIKDCAWLGLIGDDCVPETPQWDARLIGLLGSFATVGAQQRFAGIVSCNDGWQAPKRLANCWIMSGPVIEAVGYIFPPGLHHLYVDDVWEMIGREAECWVCAMDVMVQHRHVLKGEAPADDTHNRAYGENFMQGEPGGLWPADARTFAEWRLEERHRAVQAVRDIIPAAPAVVHSAEDQAAMERLEYVKTRSVYFLTPVYRNPCWDYSSSLLKTQRLFDTLGIRNDFLWLGGLPIHTARNQLAAAFMGGDFTDALLIDDDMGWTDRDALRLVASRHDFVGAAGRKRLRDKPNSDPSVWCVAIQDVVQLRDDMGAITGKTGHTKIGAAFLKLTRTVFEQLAAAVPEAKLAAPDKMEDAAKAWYYRFFTPLNEEGGEDFKFCELWQDICGGRVWVDPSIRLRHWGDYAFEGSLSEIMEPDTA